MSPAGAMITSAMLAAASSFLPSFAQAALASALIDGAGEHVSRAQRKSRSSPRLAYRCFPPRRFWPE